MAKTAQTDGNSLTATLYNEDVDTADIDDNAVVTPKIPRQWFNVNRLNQTAVADYWTSSVAGTGSVTLGDNGKLTLSTGATSSSTAQILGKFKCMNPQESGVTTHRVRYKVTLSNIALGTEVQFGLQQITGTTAQTILLHETTDAANTYKMQTAAGASSTQSSTFTITAGTAFILELVQTGSTSTVLKVDDVTKATNTTNLAGNDLQIRIFVNNASTTNNVTAVLEMVEVIVT